MIESILARLFVYVVFGALIYSIFKILLNYSEYQTKLQNGEKDSLKKLETRREPFNLVGMIILLLFIFVLINIKVGFEFDGTEGDLPGKVMAIIPAILSLSIIVINIIQNWRGEKKVRRYGLLNEDATKDVGNHIKLDLKRKFYHLFVFILIFVFLYLGYLLIQKRTIHSEYASFYLELLDSYWGSTNGLNYVELIFIRHSLPLAQTLTFLFMYGAMLVLLVIDLTRLSKKIHFIMHKESQSIMRYKELDTLGAYTHFAVSYLFASMVLPPMLFLASLCLASFADPTASIVGIKIGKKRYSWNSKSLEGTIAGSIMAFITMFWFVGGIYALAGALLFALVDVFTPKPIELSDNLVMPVLITIVFVVLSLCGIPARAFAIIV
ncbi:MAG: hypothetical protein ACTSVZ_09030 [Promethearchaeota archaeon]